MDSIRQPTSEIRVMSQGEEAKSSTNVEREGNKSYIQQILDWLLAQPPATVIAVLGTGILAYGFWVGIPRALDSINTGYETINTKNAEVLDKLEDRHAKERQEAKERLFSETQRSQAAYEKSAAETQRAVSELKDAIKSLPLRGNQQ